MKKILALLLAALLLIGLAGCDTILDVAEAVIVEALEQSESLPDQSASLPEQSESLPDQSASLPEQSASLPEQSASLPEQSASVPDLAPDGSYTTKEDVALYLHLYGELPGNFITKQEARALGWESGGLDGYADGKCIGGDRFGNYEGLLPEQPGRSFYECDIDTMHQEKRGAKRIVFSNDGLIYYTGNHYKSFELLYGEE